MEFLGFCMELLGMILYGIIRGVLAGLGETWFVWVGLLLITKPWKYRNMKAWISDNFGL